MPTNKVQYLQKKLAKSDPLNRLYARQSRFRLDAEFVRDSALSISGLLINDIGGKSVKPYQPAGYWRHLNFPARKWQAGKGNDLYRKRTLHLSLPKFFTHPAMLAFDAPSRKNVLQKDQDPIFPNKHSSCLMIQYLWKRPVYLLKNS